jgi:hypothetical protein
MSALAILGGAPVRPRPFAAWPQYLESDLRRVREAIESRHWGGYPMPSRYAGEFAEKFAALHGGNMGCAWRMGPSRWPRRCRLRAFDSAMK